MIVILCSIVLKAFLTFSIRFFDYVFCILSPNIQFLLPKYVFCFLPFSVFLSFSLSFFLLLFVVSGFLFFLRPLIFHFNLYLHFSFTLPFSSFSFLLLLLHSCFPLFIPILIACFSPAAAAAASHAASLFKLSQFLLNFRCPKRAPAGHALRRAGTSAQGAPECSAQCTACLIPASGMCRRKSQFKNANNDLCHVSLGLPSLQLVLALLCSAASSPAYFVYLTSRFNLNN